MSSAVNALDMLLYKINAIILHVYIVKFVCFPTRLMSSAVNALDMLLYKINAIIYPQVTTNNVTNHISGNRC